MDRSAPRVVGWYLLDTSRAPQFDLAASADIWRRRTAAFWLIRQSDIDDPLALADKPIGTAPREIGRVDAGWLVVFLSEHAATMHTRDPTPRSPIRRADRPRPAPVPAGTPHRAPPRSPPSCRR
ncbi:DNA alkylation repair protein [Virgisporangium ochraceum]|uniref:DNA alkylation repair protein n=1 Tax=Virgisporangium ochraceum TaxID=65505 RepID=UPI0035A248BA